MADSIGIDIVSCQRIASDLNRFGERFLDRILGPEERSLYDRRPDGTLFLAGRLAAKEALIKALGKYLKEKPPFASMQILNDEKGMPYIRQGGDWQSELPPCSLLVSISHEKEYAAAVVVITEVK